MKTYFNVGKIYRIESFNPYWRARILGGNEERIDIPRGTEVVLLKESKRIDEIEVVVLTPNGTICCTTVRTTELHKWILTTQ